MNNINTEEYWNKKWSNSKSNRIDVQEKFNAIAKFIPKDSKILDIGSGLGDLLNIIYQSGLSKHLYAADISSESLMKTSLTIPEVNTIKLSYEPKEIEEKDFDVIIINHVLEHIETPEKYFNKWAKSLKPDGTIIVAVPLNDKPYIEHLRIYNYNNFEMFIRSLGYNYLILTKQRPMGTEEIIGILSKSDKKLR